MRDSLALDRHLGIKRWERQAQRASWRRRHEESEAPLLPCRSRTNLMEPALRPAALLALFEEDFALVRFDEKEGRTESPAEVRILRGGIPWEIWHPWLLRAYLRGAVVPVPLNPLRRIPPQWLEDALRWNAALQGEFFNKLRETKVLPRFQKLDATAISKWMRWEDLRANFLDFKELPSTAGSALKMP